MSLLDQLAKEYVDLTLIKHQFYDQWDVYWLADTLFWKRQDLMFSRTSPHYPYKPLDSSCLTPDQAEMTLEDILCAALDVKTALQDLEGKC